MRILQGSEVLDDGRLQLPIENLWHRVRRWAKRNGFQYRSTYGVENVAPT